MSDLSETRYEDRTDSVEEKLRLLQAAYGKGDYGLAMSLSASIGDTLSLARQRQQPAAEPVCGAGSFGTVSELPPEWAQWAQGWAYYKVLEVSDEAGLARSQEPVDLAVAFPGEQVTDLARELRVARVDDGGALREVTSQVCGEVDAAGERHCRVIFMADVPAGGRTHYLVFYGNPFAELPAYPSPLRVNGEGYGLDIENEHYVARLSRQMGQLERLTYRTYRPGAGYRQSHGLELFAGGEGHGEPPHIDWAHDYLASNRFQKFRVTNWAECPNYEVVRGPLCVQVRRWGFPHSPAHPLFTPSRMHIDVEYTFYAGQPYIVKDGRMEMIKDFELNYLRDDEWVFSGYTFTDMVWMDRDGALHEGPVTEGHGDDLWGVGFYHETSRDAFIALFLEHSAENFDALYHAGAPSLDYQGHGQIWSRWAARNDPQFKAGAVLKQKNAYLMEPYDGPAKVEAWRQRLLQPVAVSAGQLPGGTTSAAGRLARTGETEESAPLKKAVWAALREVPDTMFYDTDANVVDMGYIYDVRVSQDVVRVLMTTAVMTVALPHQP